MNSLANDPYSHRRVLVVDDNTAIHDDFRKILAAGESGAGAVDAEAAALFGGDPIAVSAAPAAGEFALEFAPQGQAALAQVRAARAAGRPFALAFVDMRMPPGWDGLTTILELWKADPEIQTVICTAYSDRSWEEIQAALTARDRWLVLKKPFDRIEVLQLANSLTEKWKLARLAAMKLEALEELVAARTRELVAAHRVKGEFLTNASHELLTPMNGVAGFLELLDTTPLNAEQADFVREAQACGRRLHTLIRQMLDFNAAESGAPETSAAAFAPRELLATVVGQHTPNATSKGLRLHADVPADVAPAWLGPCEAVRKTLEVLVDNAIKFTPAGSVTLGVALNPVGLEFAVEDTGVGLSPEELEWVRIPFAQVDGGVRRRSSGFGLGLPLAHRLVRCAGGELRLNGAPSRGVRATFTVRACPT